MGESANTIPPSGFGKLQLGDVVKSVALAVFTNLLMSLYSIINTGGFPTKEDWMDIIRTSIAFMISYILKNLLTNNTGDFATKDKEVVIVPAKELDKVIDKAQQADEKQ